MARSPSVSDDEVVTEDKTLYELCVLIPHPLSQKDEQVVWKEVEKLIEEGEGKVTLKDSWGRRGLAYKIGGFTEGAYTIYYVEMDPSKVRELDKQLRILKNVLRHMVIKPPKNYKPVEYGKLYDKWEEEGVFQKLRQSQEKQEKQEKMVMEKAKNAAKKATARTKKADDVSDKPKMSEEAISQEVSKLISDETLDI